MTTRSALLAPGVGLHPTRDGHVLTTADGDVHAVRLAEPDVTTLVTALASDRRPGSGVAAAAYDALVAAGHAVAPSPHVVVQGTGPLARAVEAALERCGAALVRASDADLVVRVGTPEPAPDPEAATDPSTVEAWTVDGHLVVAPRAVRGADVAARWRAAAVRRTAATDPDLQPVPGPAVSSAHHEPGPLAREVAAHAVALEALRRAGTLPAAADPGTDPAAAARHDHLALVVDLRTAETTRRPVLPVPAPPR